MITVYSFLPQAELCISHSCVKKLLFLIINYIFFLIYLNNVLAFVSYLSVMYGYAWAKFSLQEMSVRQCNVLRSQGNITLCACVCVTL